MKTIGDKIKNKQKKLFAITGYYYQFRLRRTSSNSNKFEYHIIPPEGSDSGFHLFRSCSFGIKWYPDPAKAVKEFFQEYNEWKKQIRI